jgi:nucleoside-diphosphate kinase
MTEKTLVLIKPDGVQRSLVGKIIERFENVGLKIIAMKMVWIDKEFAKKHYTDDISKRRGEKVRNLLLDLITMGPIVAIALEGIEAVNLVRKMVGETEPSSAAPGTIRGDFAHVNFQHADKVEKAIRNLVHASGNKEEAKAELKLWFKDNEMHSYESVHDKHILHK